MLAALLLHLLAAPTERSIHAAHLLVLQWMQLPAGTRWGVVLVLLLAVLVLLLALLVLLPAVLVLLPVVLVLLPAVLVLLPAVPLH